MTGVLLVDDHAVVREGLASILGGEPDIEVVGQFGTAEQALERVGQLKPDVAVIDIRLPGINGVDATTALLARHPHVRVIVLTSYPSEGAMLAAFSAGARGFLVKESAEPAVLCQAVRAVVSGGTFVDPRVAGKLVSIATKRSRARGPYNLTLQEMRVLALLPRGLSNREIGQQLGVSEHTVKTHLHNAMRKLNVHDRGQAGLIATREGFA